MQQGSRAEPLGTKVAEHAAGEQSRATGSRVEHRIKEIEQGKHGGDQSIEAGGIGAENKGVE
jgi:hypothetical protein